MDPQVAWNDLLEAYEAYDWEAVRVSALALRQWIEKGGFPPNTQFGRRMDDAWHRAVTLSTCQFVLDASRRYLIICESDG